MNPIIDLVFDGRAYAVPKKSVFELLQHDRALMDATAYSVHSSVPEADFALVVDYLKSETKIPVTKDNAVSLWLLARELYKYELASECATFSISIEHFASLSERVAKLERQTASASPPESQFHEELISHERVLEQLRMDVETIKQSVSEPLIVPERPALGRSARISLPPDAVPLPSVAPAASPDFYPPPWLADSFAPRPPELPRPPDLPLPVGRPAPRPRFARVYQPTGTRTLSNERIVGRAGSLHITRYTTQMPPAGAPRPESPPAAQQAPPLAPGNDAHPGTGLGHSMNPARRTYQ
jgi:hypothetical protein